MSISFENIPSTLRVPIVAVEFDNSRAMQGTPQLMHKILVLGQRLSTGTVAAGVLTRAVSAAAVEEAAGRGSMLSAMFNALKAANRYTDTYFIAQDEAGAGAAATGTVTIGGTVTQAGTYCLYIAGKAVKIAVAAAQAAATTATALAAAINADTTLPVTASANAAVVTVTCRWKGESGNYIDLRNNYYDGEALPKGMTAVIVAMANGTTNPDIAAAIALFGDEKWDAIVMPYTDSSNMALLEAELLTRFTDLRLKAGVAFCAFRGSHGTTITFGDGRNSELVSCMGTGSVPDPPWIWAAVNAAVADASLSIDPARPLQTLPLTGLKPPAIADRWILEERNLLLWDGISTYTVDAGGVVRIDRQITMYQENASGVADESYLDVTTLFTIIYLAQSLAIRFTNKFPRHKLADDGTNFDPGQAIVTPKILRAELLALAREWERAGLVENLEQFKADLIVERDPNVPTRANALVPPDIVNGFLQFAALLQFRL